MGTIRVDAKKNTSRGIGTGNIRRWGGGEKDREGHLHKRSETPQREGLQKKRTDLLFSDSKKEGKWGKFDHLFRWSKKGRKAYLRGEGLL